MKLINSRCLVLVAVLLLLASCGGKEKFYQEQSYVFGTLVEISLYGEEEARAKQLTAQVFADFDRLHTSLHPWKPGTLSRVNEILALAPARAATPPGLIPIIQGATRLSEQSGGLFNPAIGKLVELWGFHSEEFKPQLPDPQQVAKLVAAHPRMSDVVLDGIEIYSKNPAVKIDLGGYAKGYALDVAAEYLKSQGVKNALINIGGNVMALGQRGDRPWRVGIQHPRKAQALAALELRDGEAIGTSGDYQRYFIFEGRRYCHIIDPRTGYPVQGVQAATVIIPPGRTAGVLSDAASKPIFIEGISGWREAAREMGVGLALLVDDKGEIYLTQGLQQRLEWIEKPAVLHVVP